MHSHFHLHLPHYFASKVRKEVEHLYASTAVGNLAQAIIALFEPIFLYVVLGLSITEVLLFAAVVYGLYIVLIPFGAKIAARFGYAHSILLSIPFQILLWMSLIGSQYYFELIYIAPVLFALQKIFFWPAWHATLARFAHGKQVAREFSAMYAIMNLVQIMGPMIGGFLTMFFGVNSVFLIGSLIYACSAIPLLLSKEIFVPKPYRYRDTWELVKKYPVRFAGYLGFGEELLVMIIWPIFIYMIVKDYQNLGSLVTIASLAATGLALLIGIYSDKYGKKKILQIGGFFYVLSWLARIPVISPFGVFITDAISRTAKSLVFIPVTAMTYERAETTHIMPYVVGMEQLLCVGKFLAAVMGIVVFAATGSFIALFILAAVFSLFYFLI
ncbi:MFS transporter [bacterium]|nr:MAG: MFS transporter [bacterium]